ncbi:MAG: hypothetical protein HQL40_21105, partial [Alphaproteobacteria bacterium]|nr:hypothetical protein [Alphaproteobacteria bacterium]
MGTIEILSDPAEARTFQTFTFPKLRDALSAPPPGVLAVGLRVGGRPAGLALGGVVESEARLDS